jgi:hypothetical protein
MTSSEDVKRLVEEMLARNKRRNTLAAGTEPLPGEDTYKSDLEEKLVKDIDDEWYRSYLATYRGKENG